ncbi:FtsK/SpoIIIE domain-containing protein (plasmid) [Clostridium perfringens]
MRYFKIKDLNVLKNFYLNKDLESEEIQYHYGKDNSKIRFVIQILIITSLIIILGGKNKFFSFLSLVYIGYLAYLIYSNLKRFDFSKKKKFVRNMITHLLDTNGFIVSEKINGDTYIRYAPTISYKILPNGLVLKFYLDGSKFQDKYLDLDEKLKHLFEMRIKDKRVEMGIVTYVLTNEIVAPFQFGSEIEGKKIKKCGNRYSINFNNEICWDFRQQPHALITGATGGGKTYVLYYIIRNLLSNENEIKIIDPKNDVLSYLSNFIGKENVSSSVNQAIKILREASELINKRSEEFKQRSDYSIGKDWNDYGYKALFIIMDEVASLMASCDSKQSKELNGYLTEIILKGRSAGVMAVLTTQRADTEVISGKIRDNLGLRLSCGALSPDGLVMTFGNQFRDLTLTLKSIVKPNSYSGVGFIFLNGLMNKPQEFYAPILTSEYDFFEDIKKIIDLNKVD